MRLIADKVWQLSGAPRDWINVFLVNDVLIDAGTRWARGRILGQLHGRKIRAVALTHCHPDHQGAARFLCDHFGVPLACHEADIPAAEGQIRMQPDNWIVRLGQRFWAGPACPVGKALRDGDEIAGFRVIHAPGHTPGHIMLFRDADRIAIAGDVLANINFITGKAGLRQPPTFFSTDPAENRRSIRKLVDLKPRTVCFGHGPPLRDFDALKRYAERVASSVNLMKSFPKP